MSKARQRVHRKLIQQTQDAFLKAVLDARADDVREHNDSPKLAAAIMLGSIRLYPRLSVRQLSRMTGIPARDLRKALSSHGCFSRKRNDQWEGT